MRKAPSITLIVIFTIASLYALGKYIRMDSFSFAWALNFLLMLCVHTFTDTLKSKLNSAYYNEKRWESKGEIYEYLGVNFFRNLLVRIGWERLIRKSLPIESNTEALTKLHYQTKKSELDHLIVFFIVLGFTVLVAMQFGVFKSLWLLVLNILLNVYPIFLQRYNRPRIERIIRLSKFRESID